MCEIVEKIIEEAVMEDRIERARRAITVLYSLSEEERDSRKLTQEKIACIYGLPLSKIEELAREQAKTE